jgi:hypothetical protein
MSTIQAILIAILQGITELFLSAALYAVVLPAVH